MKSSLFISTNTGLRLELIIAFTGEAKVNTGIITSESLGKFKDFNANSIPVVPLLTDNDFFFKNLKNASSNFKTNFP